MPLFYNRIKEQLLFFDSKKTKIVIFFYFWPDCKSNSGLWIDDVCPSVCLSVRLSVNILVNLCV